MKKTIATLIFVMVAAATFAQELLNVNKYFPLFSIKEKKDIIDSEYVWSAPTEDERRFASIDGNLNMVDTPLEFALLSYYSQPVITTRPVQADAILPANNPKLADLKLGAAVFQEIQILRFLGNTAAVNRHEGVLKFITDRKNVTRAEIEKYYRDGIRSLVSDIVDEEFNKISFFIENLMGSSYKSYNGVLTRNPQNGRYTLSYEDAKYITKELSAPTLEALLAALSKSGDFSPAAVDTVRAQAALIPAVYYEKNNLRTLSLIKDAVVKFYENPTRASYNVVKNMYSDFVLTEVNAPTNRFFRIEREAFEDALKSLHPALADRIAREVR